MYPYNTVGWDLYDSLSSIYTCRSLSREINPKLKWVSNIWVNVWVLESGKKVFNQTDCFFPGYFCVFCNVQFIEHACWLSTQLASQSVLHPNHCFSLSSPPAFTVLFILLLANPPESSLPSGFCSILSSLLCWLAYLITTLPRHSLLFLILQYEAKWSFYLLEDFQSTCFLKTSPL